MAELDSYKKEFGRKRRTVVENAEEAVFEGKEGGRTGSRVPDGSVWLCEDC